MVEILEWIIANWELVTAVVMAVLSLLLRAQKGEAVNALEELVKVIEQTDAQGGTIKEEIRLRGNRLINKMVSRLFPAKARHD